jgi:DNA-directed RNA polymerase subunit RPC12/RpoP
MSVDIQLVCPNCYEDPEIDRALEEFDVIECGYCGVKLVVTGENPVVLSLIAEDEFESDSEDELDSEEEE